MSLNKENVVIVGKKSTINYVIACLTILHSGSKELTIKSRGLTLYRAIETVEMLRKSFVKNLEIKKIKIGSQEYERFGKPRFVSFIEITLLLKTS